jgi:hypothetical protein
VARVAAIGQLAEDWHLTDKGDHLAWPLKPPAWPS